MIFVTLGSQKFQFNRLLKAVDELIDDQIITETVFAQTGYSSYIPQNYNYKNFLDRKDFIEIMKQSEIIITHGGTGAIINALKNEKKVIAVPRKASYKEHVDDHQSQIVQQFADLKLICGCTDCEKLKHSLEDIKTASFKKYESNTHNIIESIETFIEGQTI